MRTNIEDDVITSGRLGAFMRAARLLDSSLSPLVKDELMAMGALVFTYRDSQVKRFTTGERDRLRSILAVRLGDVADQVIDALLAADLARPRGKKISVKGNTKQVTRLKTFRSNSSKGGKKRADSATRGKDGTFAPGKDQVPPADSSLPNSLLLSPTPRSLNTEEGARAASRGASAASSTTSAPPLSTDDDEPKAKKPRSTRGFPEAAFEAEFVERGAAAKVVVAKFNDLELSIGGQLVARCGSAGVTQSQLLAEWWRPEWRVWHGFDVRALDKHFAKVRAAIADPKMRPKQRDDASEQKPSGWRAIPSAEETRARKAAADAEAERIANDPNEQAGIAAEKAKLREMGML